LGGVAALVCAISFAVFMLALALVALKLARTISTTNRMLEDVRRQTLPLMGKLQTAMDHVNREMGYLDSILEAAQKLAERVGSVAEAARRLVNSPLFRVLSLGVGAQRTLAASAAREEGPERREEGS